MKITLIITFILLFVPSILFSATGTYNNAKKRIALVIGNSTYKDSPLKNPVNDADDMTKVLVKLGFDVVHKNNVTLKTMEKVIRDFGKKLRNGGIGLFYFAGHGMQVNGQNYLIPVDANIDSESEVKYESVNAGRILGQMKDAGNNFNIVILDACRNNPFSRNFRNFTRGLARMDAPHGLIIAYATAPGSVASDGLGRNGVYTKNLLLNIKKPNMPIEKLFKLTRIAVSKETGGVQTPWEVSSLMGDFHFATSTANEEQSVKLPENNDDFDFEAIIKVRKAKKKKWTAWQAKMESVYIKCEKYDKSPELTNKEKMGMWAKFLSSFNLNNLNEVSDDKMRKNARLRKKYWDKKADDKSRLSQAESISSDIVEADKNNKIINNLKMKFVYIPAGDFMMGSPLNEPNRDSDEKQHRVILTDGFYMQTTEVTVGQWRVFVNDTGYKTEAETDGGAWIWIDSKWEQKEDCDWDNPGFVQTDSCPVTSVSWNDVNEFILWINKNNKFRYCLPTEAQWEYAARGEKQTLFAFGNCLSTSTANYNGDYPMTGCSKGEYRKRTVPVSQFLPNKWGLFDMHGNVWEWCQDWYGDYSSEPITNPKGLHSGAERVARGGGWCLTAGSCRSANRNSFLPSFSYYYLGFRLVRLDKGGGKK